MADTTAMTDEAAATAKQQQQKPQRADEAADLAARPPLPRVTIQFCTQCKWMLRAAYVCTSPYLPYPTRAPAHLPLSLPLSPSYRRAKEGAGTGSLPPHGAFVPVKQEKEDEG